MEILFRRRLLLPQQKVLSVCIYDSGIGNRETDKAWHQLDAEVKEERGIKEEFKVSCLGD